MRQTEAGKSIACCRHTRVGRQIIARVKRELGLAHFKEHDARRRVEFWQPEDFRVEAGGSGQIGHAKCDEADAGFHLISTLTPITP